MISPDGGDLSGFITVIVSTGGRHSTEYMGIVDPF